jgi:endo-1,4-beta-xylanase
MKKTMYRFSLAAMAAALVLALGTVVVACDTGALSDALNPGGSAEFVAVENVTGIVDGAVKNTAINLGAAVVSPSNATHKTIVWSVTDAGTTGAGSVAPDNTVKPTAAGTLVVTATIANGLAEGTPYTKEFSITISEAFVAVTDITWTSPAGRAGTALDLSGVSVTPSNATHKAITWSVATDSEVDAVISGESGEQPVIPQTEGTLKLAAVIANGTAEGTDYTQTPTFEVEVVSADEFVAVERITWTPPLGRDGTALELSGV